MSASREKKKRQEQYETGSLVRDAKKTSNGGLSKLASWLVGIAAIIIAVAFVCLMVFNSSTFLNHVTAVRVGDTTFSAAQAGYYYWDSANTVANYYGDYFKYFVDTTKSFKSQNYSEDMTWADYFMNTAETSMQQQLLLSDAAKAANFALTDEQMQNISANLAALETSAKNNGYADATAYLKAVYGKAASVDTYRDYLTMQALASAYYTEQLNSYSYTQDQLDSYYAEHKNDFDTVSYRVLAVSSDENTVDPKAEAERIAEASAHHEAVFLEEATKRNAPTEEEIANGAEEYDAESTTLCEDYSYSQTNSACADWLFDEARLEGETYVAEYNNGSTTTYYVIYFLSRQAREEKLVNVRHILVPVSDSSDETAKAEAKAKAEQLLSDWQDGEATEDSFAALANENSTDTGSNTNGGLYENVYPGQMVDAFNDWCFDASRQAGDTGIVETTYGYHVMYFSGYSTEYGSYQDYLVENTLRSNDYNAWFDAKAESYPISENGFGMLFVNR